MHQCTFELNDQPLSSFNVGTLSVPAFSGLGSNINKRAEACTPDLGPIPPGTYYILDRESGGMLGPLWDRLKGRTEWFALYAADQQVDDYTYCNQVLRGNFRLHPRGPAGISKGCIVIDKKEDFQTLRALLIGAPKSKVPGTAHLAYGQVIVT